MKPENALFERECESERGGERLKKRYIYIYISNIFSCGIRSDSVICCCTEVLYLEKIERISIFYEIFRKT